MCHQVLPWGDVAERLVRPDLVVAVDPVGGRTAQLALCFERIAVEHLLAIGSVEASDQAVLHRIARPENGGWDARSEQQEEQAVSGGLTAIAAKLRGSVSIGGRLPLAMLWWLVSVPNFAAQQIPEQTPVPQTRAPVLPHHQPSSGATLPLKVMDGYMVVAVDLTSKAAKLSTSLIVDLGDPHGLALQDAVRHGLELKPDESSISVSAANGFAATVPVSSLVDYQGPIDFAEISLVHDAELGDSAVGGTVGAGFLRNYRVLVDVAQHELTLAAPGDADRPLSGDVVVPAAIGTEGALLLPLSAGKKAIGSMTLSGAGYDSVIDAGVAIDLGFPTRNVGPVRVTDAGTSRHLNLSDFIAFRPSTFDGHDAAAGRRTILVAGLNLFENFRVEIDWIGRSVALTPAKAPSYPVADAAFYEVENSRSADRMAAYLEKHPDARLARAGAKLLVEWRLKENADDERLLTAARWLRDTTPRSARSAVGLALMAYFAQAKPPRPDLVVGVGRLALEAARTDKNPGNLYLIHHEIGKQLLAQDNVDGAWTSFLSAAFGLPDNASVNLDLARTYDKQGRVRRAYSRYQRAAQLAQQQRKIGAETLTKDELSELNAALVRLRKGLKADDPLLTGEQDPR